jgi:hypothetical protein
MNGPQQLFVCHRAIFIWHQTEFIRSVTENVDHEATEAVDLYLFFSVQTSNPQQ